jgi:O-antigen ligase
MLFGMGMLRLMGYLKGRILDKTRSNRALVSFLVSLGLLLGLLLAAGLLLLAAGFVMSKVDPRMKTLFNLSALREFSLMRYANQLVFAERVVFWETGWNIFNDFPVFGVGLGNAGYFFPQKLSYFAWGLTEIRTLMFQSTTIPNTKSLWIRLLAETGILGAALFMSWLYVVWASALRLYKKSGLAGTVGLAGLFVLVGLLAEGFSVDTFALPYFWVSFGIVTALASTNAWDNPGGPKAWYSSDNLGEGEKR